MFQRIFFIFFILLFSLASQAASTIPKPLQPWVPWVKQDHQFIDCPYINHGDYQSEQSHLCAWPSPLDLKVTNSGGTFTQQWQILQQSLIPLPGDPRHWPQGVSANGKPLVVVTRHNKPYAQLDKGRYDIKGEFLWQQIPQSIEIPKQYALVNLSVNSHPVDFAKLEKGELWLSEQRLGGTQADSSTIEVYRLVEDGPFIRLVTQIQLKVSGKKREQALGKVLPPGFSLIKIDSDISAYLDAEGVLHAKLQPGSWQLEVVAFANANLTSWQHSALGYAWPQQELWAFNADSRFRSGKIKGGSSIDVSQTQMPLAWQQYPTYLLNPGESLTYAIDARGQTELSKNKLQLKRDLWLDFDAKQYTFVDKVSGEMAQHWRLNMAPPYHLESATADTTPILITQSDNDRRGVELRNYDVDVEAIGHLDKASELPVSGWDSEFEKVKMTVHLPPAYRLFAVFGADTAYGSWLGKWTIWSMFIVLFSVILVTRMMSPALGILTALVLVLTLHESLSPVVLLVNLVFACIVLKHNPFAKLQKWCKGYLAISFVLFGINALAFAATQLQHAVHPQLEAHQPVNAAQPTVERQAKFGRQKEDGEDQFSTMPQVEAFKVLSEEMASLTPSKIALYQPDSNLQAGPGKPDWRWRMYHIDWESPVTAGQNVSIIIQPAWLTRLLQVLGVILLALWLLMLFNTQVKKGLLNSIPQAAVAFVLVGLFAPYGGNVAYASDLPDEHMLKALQQRVLEAPKCAPQCFAVANMTVDISADTLSIEMQVHALTDTAISLPSSPYWRAQKVSVNSQPQSLMLNYNNKTYIAVRSGISQVSLKGAIAPVEQFQLLFEPVPLQVSLNKVSNWDVVGLDGNHLSANTLSFTIQTQQDNQQRQSSRYIQHPIVSIARDIDLQSQWLVTTTVRRIAPYEGAINIDVPLLPGEHINTANIKVIDTKAQVSLGAKQNRLVWTSTLDIRENITLEAPSDLKASHRWHISSAPIWHVRTSGLPEIDDTAPQMGRFDEAYTPPRRKNYASRLFYPYPGESLTLQVKKPEAVKGNIVAIDNVMAVLSQGERSANYELTFSYRATKGGEHTIKLPPDFELVKVSVNDEALNLQSNNAQLTLPISPGKLEVAISMRKDAEPNMWLAMPQTDLNTATSNIKSVIKLTDTRWTLYTDGPLIGPAVIYWGELLIFLVLAVLLGRYPFSPLNTRSWLLLGLGLSLYSWWTFSAMVFWFAMLKLSQLRSAEMNADKYNLSQLSLYLLSIVTLYKLVISIPATLLGSPEMGIKGYFSKSHYLQWFSDKSTGLTPHIEVFNVSIYIYKGIMLLWVLWLSFALINWCKWAWQCLGRQGYWRKVTGKEAAATPAADDAPQVSEQQAKE